MATHPLEFPIEIVLKILHINLDPRDHQTRTESLLDYCLINKATQCIFQPLLLEHPRLYGEMDEVSSQMEKLESLLSEGEEQAQLRVKTLHCTFMELEDTEALDSIEKLNGLLKLCPRLEELAFEAPIAGDVRPILTGLLPNLPRLRVLFLANLHVDIFQDALATSPIRHLSTDECDYYDLTLGSLQQIESFSAGKDFLQLNNSVKECFPNLRSLRLRHDALRVWMDWPTSLTSLEVVGYHELYGLKGLETLLSQLTRLHSAVTPKDLHILCELIRRDTSPLKHLRLHLERRQREDFEVGPTLREASGLQSLKSELEDICQGHGVQLIWDGESATSGGAVQFWEACNREQFILRGV